MMDMGSMMGWMMTLGLLGWLLVIGLLVAILVVLIRILNRSGPGDRGAPPPPREGSGQVPR